MLKKIQTTYRHLCGVKVPIHSHQSILEALNQEWFGGCDALLQSVSHLSLAASHSQQTPWVRGPEAVSWDLL